MEIPPSQGTYSWAGTMACVTTSIPADGGPVGTQLPPESSYCPP